MTRSATWDHLEQHSIIKLAYLKAETNVQAPQLRSAVTIYSYRLHIKWAIFKLTDWCVSHRDDYTLSNTAILGWRCYQSTIFLACSLQIVHIARYSCLKEIVSLRQGALHQGCYLWYDHWWPHYLVQPSKYLVCIHRSGQNFASFTSVKDLAFTEHQRCTFWRWLRPRRFFLYFPEIYEWEKPVVTNYGIELNSKNRQCGWDANLRKFERLINNEMKSSGKNEFQNVVICTFLSLWHVVVSVVLSSCKVW